MSDFLRPHKDRRPVQITRLGDTEGTLYHDIPIGKRPNDMPEDDSYAPDVRIHASSSSYATDADTYGSLSAVHAINEGYQILELIRKSPIASMNVYAPIDVDLCEMLSRALYWLADNQYNAGDAYFRAEFDQPLWPSYNATYLDKTDIADADQLYCILGQLTQLLVERETCPVPENKHHFDMMEFLDDNTKHELQILPDAHIAIILTSAAHRCGHRHTSIDPTVGIRVREKPCIGQQIQLQPPYDTATTTIRFVFISTKNTSQP